MKTVYYRLAPLEPLTARDSRPQSVGGHTLDSLPPGVVAGAVAGAAVVVSAGWVASVDSLSELSG